MGENVTPADANCYAAELPALPPGCNSWIAQAPEGCRGHKGCAFVEVTELRDVEMLARCGWKIRTALDHLAWINTNKMEER